MHTSTSDRPKAMDVTKRQPCDTYRAVQEQVKDLM